jgi:hypothetical protein
LKGDDDYNLLVDELPCPACGKLSKNVARFRVGPCKYYEYKLGEAVDWSRKGPVPFPAQKGKAKLKQTVTLKACEACRESRAAAAKGVRELLAEQERLAPYKKEERLVDGVYPERGFVDAELDRLGYAPQGERDATLLISGGVLESVTPAKTAPAPAASEETLRLRALEFAVPATPALRAARAEVEALTAPPSRDGAHTRRLAAALNVLLALGTRSERSWLADVAKRPSKDELLAPLLDLARQALDYRLEGRSARVGFVTERVGESSWIFKPTLFEAVEIKRRTAAR